MQTWKKIAIISGSFICLSLIVTVYALATNKSHIKSREATPDTMIVPRNHIQIHDGPSTGDKVIRLAEKGEKLVIQEKWDNWYKVSNENVSGFIFKPTLQVKKTQERKELKDRTIVIDAGHGGTDNGATGATGVQEKDLTLKTANRLEDRLDSLGAVVVMTRDKDEYISLGDRVTIANNEDADSFISIHYNSVPEVPEATGIGTFYFDEQDKNLANALQTEIINETDAENRELNAADFQVLKQNKNPAVLMELGFISNDEKEQLFLTDSYQKKLINGIAEGLISYFTKKEDRS